MSDFAEVVDRLRFLYESTYDIFHCNILCWQNHSGSFIPVNQLFPETMKEQTPGFQVT